MSRIDEALKRAERNEPLDDHVVAGKIAAAVPATSGLDRYVSERSGSRPTPRDRPQGFSPVPHVVDRRASVNSGVRGKLVITADIDPASLEQYRRLAAVLDATQAERGVKRLMVSSTFPREGKTLTTTNVALTLSETYKRRVLLIDADFYRPCIHELFGVPNETGLADLLRSPDAPLNPVHLSATLSLLPAGRIKASPIAALSSDALKDIVADAASHYDWVLLDTPPIGLLTDAQLIARVTDGVLFVVAAGMAPYQLVQRTIADLGPERILGMVLNRAEPRAISTHDYYDHYYKSEP